jgi:hypothetical protein
LLLPRRYEGYASFPAVSSLLADLREKTVCPNRIDSMAAL